MTDDDVRETLERLGEQVKFALTLLPLMHPTTIDEESRAGLQPGEFRIGNFIVREQISEDRLGSGISHPLQLQLNLQ